MPRKPKLTPNFADKVADLPPQPTIASFPTSRVVGSMSPPWPGSQVNVYCSSASVPGSSIALQQTGPVFQEMPFPQMGVQQISLAPPPPPARRYKVALIGTAPSSRDMAPYADSSWDIWSCSPGNMGVVPRVDAWFEIHANLHHPKYADLYGKNYLKWLSEQKFPIYMQDEEWHPKYIPNALKYPARQMVEKYGDFWFGSSFAWMVAFAIESGYKEIGLFGVDMASKEEYHQQRQSFYRWFEFAAAAGVKMTIPSESDLARPPSLYGYSEATPKGRKYSARADELAARSEAFNVEAQKVRAQLQAIENNKLYIDGAREDNEYDTSIWPERDLWGPVKRPATAEPAVTESKQVASG